LGSKYIVKDIAHMNASRASNSQMASGRFPRDAFEALDSKYNPDISHIHASKASNSR
jgi:predicted butyrate kinase (DUF1464 family)